MPEELPAVRTTITLEQCLQVLHDAWVKKLGGEPKLKSLQLLCAHWGFETGWGKSMWCYNFGNAKHVEGDGRDWTYYKCNELIKGEWKWFEPKHPYSAFRAFRTLQEGADDYFALIYDKFSNAWPAVEAADPAAYAHALKQRGYYTDPEEHYTKTMVGCMHHVASAKWPPKDGGKTELPPAHEGTGPRVPFGSYPGADVSLAAYERALAARGYRLDAGEEKNWQVESAKDLGPGNFEKLKPQAGDLLLITTRESPRSGRVVTVVGADAKSYESGSLFVASNANEAHGISVERLSLESRVNGFNPSASSAWKDDETQPGAGKAWVLRALRLSEAMPDRLDKMSAAELAAWHISKGEVIPSPGTEINHGAKQHPNDPSPPVEEPGVGKDSPPPGGKPAAAPDEDPSAFKTPPPVVQLPPPVQIDSHTVRFKVGNYPGRVAFTVKKPGEPLPVCPPPGKPESPAAEGKRDDFLHAAMNLLGAPYRAGSKDPAQGLDGPGFVGLCLKRVGLLKEGDEFPDAAALHAMFGGAPGKADAPPEEILPGDLAWYGKGDHENPPYEHPMIYLGGGRVLGPIPDGGPQNGAVQVIAAARVPEHFVGWTHLADLGRDTGHTAHPGHPPADGDALSSALLPASPSARYDTLKAMVALKKGTWLDEKGKINLVAVRSMHGRCMIQPRDDDWNDTLFACFLDEEGHKCSLELRASVNPGTDHEKANKWHLYDGSYKFKLVDGDKTGGKALQADGAAKGWLDAHGQGSLRPGDLMDDAPPPEPPAPPKPVPPKPSEPGKTDDNKGKNGGTPEDPDKGGKPKPAPKDPTPKPPSEPSKKIKSGNITVGGQDFPDWFNSTLVNKKEGFKNKLNGKQFHIVFDHVEALWAPEITLEEFVGFLGIFYNETGGTLTPVGEYGDSKYFFEPWLPVNKATGKRGRKHSYNETPLNRAAGTQLAERGIISDQADIDRWNSTTDYPDDAPAAVKEAAKQCDFYKFRGRGLIQTTWHKNYVTQVNPLMKAAGFKDVDSYTTKELDDIILKDPHIYLGMVKNFFKNMESKFAQVNQDPPVWHPTGTGVAGAASYGKGIYTTRCQTIYDGMKSAGYECR